MGSEWLHHFLWTSGAATVLSSVKLLCWEGKHQCPSCLYNSLPQFTPQLLLGVHLWALLFCSVGVVGLSEAEVDVSMLGALTYILCFFWAATGEFARVVALNQNNLLCVLNPGWSGFLFIFFTSFQCLVPLTWSNREHRRDTYAGGDKQATYPVLGFGSTIAELRNFYADLKDREFLHGIICGFTHRTQNLIF